MSLVLYRVCALATLVAGVVLGLWIVFGEPHEWEGSLKLLRFGLGLAVLGMISGSAKLMFPSASEER
ncbi:hypothetical protein ACFY1P_03325 [Streptomyces sp. NPDC001407]|uniref:hypothetical protein n=1 Tax=unclassified Streptomyces TaxID=2593676 RepID=UPI0033C3C8F5